MRLLVLGLAILTSLTSFGAREERIIEEMPTVQVYFNKQIKFLPLANFCKSGDMLETINEHKMCVEFNQERDSRGRRRSSLNCKEYEKMILATSIEHKKSKCVDYDRRRKKCKKYEDRFYVYPTNYIKTVRKQRWIGNRDSGRWGYPGVVLSKTEETVPECN
ncbi:hypothetical protein [Halobacteriovorax sp. HLS]|uniref:hypothetical protein n=1 Tax=Halobacteriovorax sp. HLS TaxID=2234000 RepID=UPI000FD7BDAB|nr:hypothetical protein [Halobacteriovorax sp. HLS]